MSSEKQVSVRLCGKTDVGCVRTNNEDNLLVIDLLNRYTPLPSEELTRPLSDNRVLIAVADGMGGAAAGEVASAIAINSLRSEFLHFSGEGSSERLIRAVEQINNQILTEAQRHRQYQGMATTITVALVERDRAYIAEVGDSRAYILRGDRIKQITTDQNWIELMIEQGLLTREQAQQSNRRNVILQALGGQPQVKVAVTAVTLAAGDTLLLCSDGLSEKLSADEIKSCLQTRRLGGKALERSCNDLIALAKVRGGEDNITVVTAHFEGEGLQANPAADELLSHIEVISIFDHVADTGVRNTLKIAAEMRGKKEINTTMAVKSTGPDSYPALAPLHEQAEALMEYCQTLELAMEQQLADLDKYSTWQLRKGRLDLPLQDSIERLKAVTPLLTRVKTALEDCNKNLSASTEKQ